MIRMIATYSEKQAKNYFADSLQPTGYYVNGQELPGAFYGKIADKLGISGRADQDTFNALCENIHPLTGERLTPKTKERRTIFYDASFHAPKSVSLISALSGDDHIVKAFQVSVRETMLEMQRDMLTRVRRNGKNEDREAGEMLIGEFIHLTARPAKGEISDPHLHAHNLIWNITKDEKEDRYKAGQFREIARSLPYYQQRYHKRFADILIALGYRIRKTNSAFEIEGVDQRVLNHFSKRTSEIGIFAEKNGITDAKTLGDLGARTRGVKLKDWSMAELKAEWRRQTKELSADGKDMGDTIIRHKEKILSPALLPENCIDYAAKHTFERLSTIHDRRLLESAYRYAVGNNSLTLADIDNAFEKDGRFMRLKDGFQTICTTKEVLGEEREMVMLARNGQNRFRPLYTDLPNIELKGQQKRAVEHILTSPNMVSIVRGAAGVGKTTTLKELDKHLATAGKQALYCAPTAQAVREVLVTEGFGNSETLARVLLDKDLQNSLQDQIIVCDEAGLIGSGAMRDLLALATRKNARVILVGDPSQHSAILRCDALRVLTKIGKIKPAEISKIRRQRNEKYRAAVQDLADGNINAAFGKLEDIEAIRQIDPLNPNAELVADYVDKARLKKSVLIVSPTHEQGQSVTADLRKELKAAKLLGQKDTVALKLVNLNLTEAQKGDWRNYKEGQTIQFDLPAPQIKKGAVFHIKAIEDKSVVIQDKAGNKKTLPLDKAKAFSLYQPTEIQLAKGDKVRITKNGFDLKEKRLDNGQLFEVVGFNKAGGITCRNRESKATYALKPDYGHIDHAYCTTSHSAQGKTCDEVLISLPGSTFVATDAKLMYVAVSRGREMVTIYTDDKEQLLENAERTGDRLSAMELVQRTNLKSGYQPYIRRVRSDRQMPQEVTTPTVTKQKYLDYEP